jgi:hypothetical protein
MLRLFSCPHSLISPINNQNSFCVLSSEFVSTCPAFGLLVGSLPLSLSPFWLRFERRVRLRSTLLRSTRCFRPSICRIATRDSPTAIDIKHCFLVFFFSINLFASQARGRHIS